LTKLRGMERSTHVIPARDHPTSRA